ncbi:nuclear pore complex protein GP210 [Carica papaya]|uniref:nuclear pore complex protein GP210 n=1 Tax=Carica papaya TaxID=3649 RepID=UPI000B8CF1B0|nr:nuclear pore complex protein GP210 [Carica papaya]
MSSHCSTSARLRSVAPYSGRKETAVYATDVRTGVVIRCKVFIDNFSRIQIFHNSIKLDLDGLATLRVRAFDSEENEFSSLVGLQFMWQLMPETDELSHHLAHVPLKDSPLSDCGGLCGYLDIRIKLEDSGLFSDLYVVKGIGIGHEKVLVRLLEPLLTHMSDKIALTVVEAMSLAPLSPLFVLIGAGLRYTLKVIRGNTPQVVYLPSPHHRWSVSNSSVAEVNSLNGFTHALNLGVTNVIVEDTRVSGHIQMSSLNVVLPDSLVLYLSHLSSISDDSLEGTKDISSGARWYIVSGREYIIQMKVFSREPDAQEIYITESDDIKLYDQQSDNWKTSLVTEQIAQKYGSLNTRILKSTSPGLGKLTASLTYFSGHLNSKEVTIEVSTLFSMIMLQNFPVETAVGSYLEAAVTLKAPNGAYFSRCDAFSLLVKWKAGSESFVLVNATREMSALDYLQNIEFPKSASGPPCSWTHIYAAGSGRTMLHATLSKEYSHFDSYFSQHVVLKATSIIAAYPPLVLRQAGDGSPFGGYWYDRAQAETDNELKRLDKLYLCTVHATVTGFCGTMNIPVYAALPKGSENVLTDTVRLQLVSTLGVNPEFNLLVFNPEAKVNLSITGGSCFLESVVNDSRVVEIIQSPPGLHCLQLVLSPKGLGTALVTVYDIGLVPPLAASAEVQVSNVDWIKILSGDEITIMEGRTESIDIVAGIKDGSTFVSSQYPYMNVCVHIEDDIIELVDPDHSSTPARGYLRAPTFKIVGKHLGVTSLHVSVKQQSGNEILSQPIKVEIYAPPRLHPNHIFLVPGASYALIMEGGPTIGVSVEYAITDDGIATVHKSSGQLSAISPGNTTILATIFGKRDAVICQAYGSVQVGVPTSASLIAQSDMLAIGREMPVFPSFYEDDLFSISELCKSYKWAIEDEKVLNFLVLEDLHDRELGFISVLHGRSAGRTNVTVSFLCEFTSSGSYFESRSYHASMPLLVVPDLPLALGVPITWVLPPFYTTSGVLPSSLETHVETDGQIRKRAISYSVLRNCDEVIRDPISIDGNRIKTKESNNIACIQAKDRASGRVDIASCVRVSEVTQIRITSQEFPFRTIDIAVGAELELPISYCDSLGNPFYEAHDVVHYNAQTNHPDVVSISTSHDGNENIRLKGMQHGKALLRVSINNNLRKADYMMVSVGARVYPRSPVVHIGSRLNFSIEGLDGQVSGHWLSANKSVITVETDSGQSEAVGEGSTQVFFQSNSMKLWTKVKVLSGNIVRVDAPKEMLTNVPPPVKGYNFLVKFSDGKSEAPRNGKAVTYNCQVNPSYVGYAKPWMDDMGNTYCPRSFLTHQKFGKKGKLSPRFIGPFEILEKYELLPLEKDLTYEEEPIHVLE